jgi:DNA polymerase
VTGFVALDVETRSRLDLKKVGAARYAVDPSTDVLCVGYAINDRPAEHWAPGDPEPVGLLADPNCLFVAHNAGFDRLISKHILAARYGWPDIPIERWRCTMTMCLALALPASLAKAAAVLGLSQQKGDKSIVVLTAKPRRPRGGEDPAAGPYWFDDPERLLALHAYCKQDVETTRELFRLLPPLAPAEQTLWCLSECINDHGFYCDGLLIEKAIAISTAADRAVQAEIKEITGGEIESTNQVAKILAWLAARGCEVADLQKLTLSQALRRTNLAPETHRVLELRQQAAHASANKAQALQAWRCADGRARGAFKFHGAATGRWSGSGPQPQNFRRETE